MLSPRANQKQLKLIFDYPETLPSRFVGDPLRLRQVLLNLLGNAVKFTERGHVALHVEQLLQTLEASILRFRVSDSGIGIPVSRQRDIFKPFTQADVSMSRLYGGSGLGLTISAQLVERMGGRLEVESTPGGGFTFQFTIVLPSANGHEEPTTFAQPPLVQQRWEVSALVVDDSLPNQKVARSMLEAMGCRVDVASDGFAAVECFMRNVYDIVFMDCSMPGLDGYQATQLLRENEEGVWHTPVIALTAHAMAGDEERWRRAGMDECMVKPVTLRSFQEVLERHCGSVVPVPTAPPAPPPDETSVFDPTFLFVSTRGDVALTWRVVSAFLDDAREGLAALGEAVRHGDGGRTRELAHKLRGSAANVGALAFSVAARAVEELAECGDGCAAALLALGAAHTRLEADIKAFYGPLAGVAVGGGEP